MIGLAIAFSILSLLGMVALGLAFTVVATYEEAEGAVEVTVEHHGFSAYWPPREDEPRSFRITSWEDRMGGTYAVMWGGTFKYPDEHKDFEEEFLDSISDAPPDIIKLFP